MGMYDSFITKCPHCKHRLEYQSKSGECMLSNYDVSNLPCGVAIGINGDIVLCQFCDKNIKLKCIIPEVVTTVTEVTDEKYHYEGNYNPKHPKSIKRNNELAKILKGETK